MQLLINLVNQIKLYPSIVNIIYMNYNTYNLLNEIIDNLSDNDYSYFSSLGLENSMLVIDNTLQDNIFELK